jgi:TRAP-type C4-dicarboxylate transport system substrate-binding protein
MRLAKREMELTPILGVAAFVLSLALTLNAARAVEPKTYVMKIGTATINESQHEWCKRFAAMVEKDTSGRIKAEIYPASQLGAIPREIEGVQFGEIQGYVGPPEFLAGINERYEVLSAPGLAWSRRRQGNPRRGAFHCAALLGYRPNPDSSPCRF